MEPTAPYLQTSRPLEVDVAIQESAVARRNYADIFPEQSSTPSPGRKKYCSKLKVSEYHKDRPSLFYTREGGAQIVPSSQPPSFDGRPLNWMDTISGPGPSNAVVQAMQCNDADGEEDYIAVKEMSFSHPADKKQAIGEIENYQSLRHNHIVAYLGCHIYEERLQVMLYPVAQHNLTQLLQQQLSGSSEMRRNLMLKKYFTCLCHALGCLHSANIKHRDIKGENILIDQFETVLLADFDQSKRYPSKSSTVSEGPSPCTIRYSAREVAEGRHREGMASDIFSLGCVFLEMATVILGKSMADLYRELGPSGPTATRRVVNLTYHTAVQEGNVLRWIEKLKLQLASTSSSTMRDRTQPLTGSVSAIGPQLQDAHLDTIVNMMADKPSTRPQLEEILRVFESLGIRCEDCQHPCSPSTSSESNATPNDADITKEGNEIHANGIARSKSRFSADYSERKKLRPIAETKFQDSKSATNGERSHQEDSGMKGAEPRRRTTGGYPEVSQEEHAYLSQSEGVRISSTNVNPGVATTNHSEEPDSPIKQLPNSPKMDSRVSRRPSTSKTNLRYFRNGKFHYFPTVNDIPGRYIIEYDPMTESFSPINKEELNHDRLKKGILVYLPRGIGRKFTTIDRKINLWKRLRLRDNIMRSIGAVRLIFQKGDYPASHLLTFENSFTS